MHNKVLRSASRTGKGARKIERKQPSGIAQRYVPRPPTGTTCENNRMYFQVSQGGISDVGLAWIYKEKYQ